MTQCGGSLAVKQPTQSEVGGSKPSSPLQFTPIDSDSATALVIEHHYKHSRCPISWSWGIKNEKREVLGVLTIGKMQSWTVRASLVGEDAATSKLDPKARSNDVYELNRLWLHDSLPRNSESQFLGWCLRQLKKEYPKIILVSYADGGKEHVGYVYQATNWIYTSQSMPFNDICVEGYTDYRSVPQEVRGGFVFSCPEDERFPTAYNELGQPETLPCPECKKDSRRLNIRSWSILEYVIDPKGNRCKVYRQQRSIKHRYVWFADPKDRQLLKWEQRPYPKIAAKQTDEKPIDQTS
jgi:hypothetical protein